MKCQKHVCKHVSQQHVYKFVGQFYGHFSVQNGWTVPSIANQSECSIWWCEGGVTNQGAMSLTLDDRQWICLHSFNSIEYSIESGSLILVSWYMYSTRGSGSMNSIHCPIVSIVLMWPVCWFLLVNIRPNQNKH